MFSINQIFPLDKMCIDLKCNYQILKESIKKHILKERTKKIDDAYYHKVLHPLIYGGGGHGQIPGWPIYVSSLNMNRRLVSAVIPSTKRINPNKPIFLSGSTYSNYINNKNLYNHTKQNYNFLNYVLDDYKNQFSFIANRIVKFINIILCCNNNSISPFLPIFKRILSNNLMNLDSDHMSENSEEKFKKYSTYKYIHIKPCFYDCYYYGTFNEYELSDDSKDMILSQYKSGYYNNCIFIANVPSVTNIIRTIKLRFRISMFGYFIGNNKKFRFIKNKSNVFFGYNNCKIYINDFNFLDIPNIDNYKLLNTMSKLKEIETDILIQ